MSRCCHAPLLRWLVAVSSAWVNVSPIVQAHWKGRNRRHNRGSLGRDNRAKLDTRAEKETCGWRAVVMATVGVGACCWPGMSHRIKRSPGGVSCRSFRILVMKSTRNRADGWVSRLHRCGLRRSLPAEGWRSFTYKPRIPSGCWASLRHPRRLSSDGMGRR
jgi:hypothetical protein